MKLNESKTRTKIFSRSRKMHPQSPTAAYQRLSILRNSWRVFKMLVWFLGDDIGVLSCQFWSTVLQCGVRLQIHLKLLYRVVSDAFLMRVGLRITQHIADLCQPNVCCIISGVTRCTDNRYSNCFSRGALIAGSSGGVVRAGQLLFYWLKLLLPFLSSTVSLSLLLSMGW